MNNKVYEYDGIIHEIPEKVKVHVTFDGIAYDGSIVNMGLKHDDGSICYIIGLLKSIRTKLKKGEGDSIHVVLKQRA